MLHHAWRVAVAMILLWAVAGKIVSPDPTIRVLIWDKFSPKAIPPLIWLVVLVETISAALLLACDRRMVVWSVLTLFAIYTIQLGLLFAVPTAPACGCMKLFATGDISTRVQTLAGIIRNLVIMGFGVWILRPSRVPKTDDGIPSLLKGKVSSA